jgi:hypothetical protein
MILVAITAVNGTIRSRLERNLGFYATLCTNNSVHFALAWLGIAASSFACIAAIAATLRLVFETFFSIEFLFAYSENESRSAVFAYQFFVLKRHEEYPPYIK